MIIDTLITDRTQADVDRVKALTAKWLNGTITSSEKTEWNGLMKGAWNYSDWNRIGNAEKYIAAILNSSGRSVTVTAPTNWTRNYIMTKARETTFLTDLNTVRNNVNNSGIPTPPTTLNFMTYEMANRIEQILVDTYNSIIRERADFEISGIAVGGVNGGL